MWFLVLLMATDPLTQLLGDRFWASEKAKRDLLAFAQLTMPTAEHPLNPRFSRYTVAKHHAAIAGQLTKVESGDCTRLILVLPPRHGKSELAVRRFVPWFAGRHPEKSVIVTTYSDTFAADHGRAVRDVMVSPGYRNSFDHPSFLRSDSQACDRLQTAAGGSLMFVGRGGSITGRGGDLIVVDDPLKDSEEAQSQLIRDKLWLWFNETLLTRLMTDVGRVVLVQTRWSEDDLVGRLLDPRNSHYSQNEADAWTVFRLPALAEVNDPMGRPVGEALWPERFSTEFLLDTKSRAPRTFSALFQGNPTPDEGTFFKADMLVTYQPQDLPRTLRKYCASDHAVSLKQAADSTVLLPAGVDETGDIWILPDVFWRQADSKSVVEGFLQMIRTHKPLLWWAESGHISKSIGPFLRDRMRAENTYCAIDEVVPVKDKQTRAQSIQGRCAMRRVHFPAFAPWWPDALAELLQFPNGAHDDFVDALAHLGMGLDRLSPAQTEKVWHDDRPKPGTIEWVKWSARDQERRNKLNRDSAGY